MTIYSLSTISVLYHFTDRRNLEAIRQHGGLHSFAQLKARGIQIPAPGGNQWSWDADEAKGMGGYVHLCFRSSHPMEHTARQDGRIENSVFLEIDPSVLQFPEVRFTPDVSNKSGVSSVPIAEAKNDYEVIYTRTDWENPTIKARLDQAEKCEVLVPSFIPLKYIRNL